MKKLLFLIAVIATVLNVYASDQPEFPGGETALKKYIAENTKYPEIARENGVEGIVVVGFLVTPAGELTNLKILKFIDPDLESEALRIVNGMPAWIPAEKAGNPIEAPAKVEVPFLLE